ncbi:helix-turn-helix domain-containing protein [Salinirubellus sp. GCM10025818]|uniref:helix-turn-helix domain-containing protein n=1 Tax=Salinirubellus TaxID=2162630 RepID=UPI0030CEFB61
MRSTRTPPQREALVAAYEFGYFAGPREASLADVTQHLDPSMGATGGRLRRGSRTLLEDHLRPRGIG